MKAGWRDAPLALRDSVVSNMHNGIFLVLFQQIFVEKVLVYLYSLSLLEEKWVE